MGAWWGRFLLTKVEIKVESKAGWSGPAKTHVSGGVYVESSKILKEHPDCGGKNYSPFLFDWESASLWGAAGSGWWCDERPKVTATIACKATMQVMAHVWHVNESKEVGWQWWFCRNYACMSQTMTLFVIELRKGRLGYRAMNRWREGGPNHLGKGHQGR